MLGLSRVKNNFWNIRRVPGCVWILKEMKHGAESENKSFDKSFSDAKRLPYVQGLPVNSISDALFILRNPSLDIVKLFFSIKAIYYASEAISSGDVRLSDVKTPISRISIERFVR